MPNLKQALNCLNKLNNYSKLPADHRWVSVVRHYIKDKNFTPRKENKKISGVRVRSHNTTLAAIVS